MALVQHRNKTVNLHKFAMTPRADIPRSRFNRKWKHKTTFDAGYLIPVHVDEMLPGDTFKVNATFFARCASAMLYPVMDNLTMSSFFFFVPNRLVDNNWVKQMGEQDNPGDSISYTTPQATSPAGGYAVNSLQDYMGLPTAPMLGANTYTHDNLIPRAYNLIWNAWFRAENIQNSVTVDKGDGPDTYSNYVLLRRGKRFDYITQALPWPQKGATAVTLPLGTSAPVFGDGKTLGITDGSGPFGLTSDAPTAFLEPRTGTYNTAVGTALSGSIGSTIKSWGVVTSGASGLIADLTAATAATINSLRLAIMTQAILERDARGGTRYTEMNYAHFGVQNPDARLQRPEYLGGASTPVIINPTVQTSGTSASGTTTPLGQLAGIVTAVGRGGHGFTYSATEHGHVIGLICIDAEITYQQGVRKMWNRQTRYDYYLPGFAQLGEQALLNRELYADGSANDTAAFGYVPRWDELRFLPSLITGLFRSTASGTLDAYHLAQKFTSLPTLNDTFIKSTPPMDRVLAIGSQTGKQFIMDSYWEDSVSRPLPMYNVPATMGRF